VEIEAVRSEYGNALLIVSQLVNVPRLVFLNITGFRDFPLGDLPMLQILKYTSDNVFVPLTVGGGIRDFTDANGRHYTSLEVASEYFRSGANKISIGSDVVYVVEEYIKTGAVVVSFDPRRQYLTSPYEVGFKSVKVNGGREGRPIRAYELAKAVEELGANIAQPYRIQGKGFNIDLIKLIFDAVSIPVIASSGARTAE
ncbi:imidazole glycerol phosphate synthase hisHF, chloroplastic, partial [Tanacetum coccineum]